MGMNPHDPQFVVITGCSSGFGYDLALKLARRGERVAATMRDPEGKSVGAAEALRDLARADNLDLRVVDLDVTSDASAQNAATDSALVEAFGITEFATLRTNRRAGKDGAAVPSTLDQTAPAPLASIERSNP